jgi:hypothetical protein
MWAFRLFVFCLGVTSVFNEAQAQEAPSDVISLFTVNAVEGFSEKLAALNQERQVTRPLMEKEAAPDAYGFLFFLRSEADRSILPQEMRAQYDAYGDIPADIFFIAQAVSPKIGRSKFYAFVLLDRLRSFDDGQIACASAVYIYTIVTNSSFDEESKSRILECLK